MQEDIVVTDKEKCKVAVVTCGFQRWSSGDYLRKC